MIFLSSVLVCPMYHITGSFLKFFQGRRNVLCSLLVIDTYCPIFYSLTLRNLQGFYTSDCSLELYLKYRPIIIAINPFRSHYMTSLDNMIICSQVFFYVCVLMNSCGLCFMSFLSKMNSTTFHFSPVSLAIYTFAYYFF